MKRTLSWSGAKLGSGVDGIVRSKRGAGERGRLLIVLSYSNIFSPFYNLSSILVIRTYHHTLYIPLINTTT